MPSPSPISALTVQPARSTVGAALRPLPGFGVNRDFFFLVISQYPVSVDSYPIKHRGHAGLSLGLMSPLFDGEPGTLRETRLSFGSENDSFGSMKKKAKGLAVKKGFSYFRVCAPAGFDGVTKVKDY